MNISQTPVGIGENGTGAASHTNSGFLIGGPSRGSVATVPTNAVSPAATVENSTVGVKSSSPTPMRIQPSTHVRPVDTLKPGLAPSATAVPGGAGPEKGTPTPTGVVGAVAGTAGPGARPMTSVARGSRVGVAEDHPVGNIGLHGGGSRPPTSGGAVPLRGVVARPATTPTSVVVSPSKEEVRDNRQHDNDGLM